MSRVQYDKNGVFAGCDACNDGMISEDIVQIYGHDHRISLNAHQKLTSYSCLAYIGELFKRKIDHNLPQHAPSDLEG